MNKKKLFIPLLMLVFIPVVPMQVGKTQGGKKNAPAAQMVQDSEQAEESDLPKPGQQVQNKKQVETKNQGEEQELNIQIQENESTQQQEENEDKPESSPKGEGKEVVGSGYKGRSSKAREQMSAVAAAVEGLLEEKETTGMQGGIGPEVKKVAQEQKKAQQEINQQLEKMEQRQQWERSLIGPNYGAINQLEREIARNQERIQILKDSQEDLPEEAQEQVEETVQALENQNEALQETIDEETDTVSAFGWLVRLFQ
jgi:hypothetical protein